MGCMALALAPGPVVVDPGGRFPRTRTIEHEKMEEVEVMIHAAEGGLDDPVQLAEMEAPGDHELTPDRRLDVEQGDAELHGG